jgi:hypothetical protein
MFTSRCLVTASNTVDSSASVFTSLPATDCLIALHDRNSWPLTASPRLATTGYHSLSQASAYFWLVKVTLRPTVSRPVSPGMQPHLGPKTTFLLLSIAVLSTWGALSDERTGLQFGAGVRLPSRSLAKVVSSGFERTCQYCNGSQNKYYVLDSSDTW